MAIMDDASSAIRVIEPDEEVQRINRLSEEADERTREVLERYGGLDAVTFGHCGYPGLCIQARTETWNERVRWRRHE